MRALLRFLLPLRCLACGAHIPEGAEDAPARPLCLDCRLRLRAPPAPRCPRCDLPRGTGSDRPAGCGRCDEWPEVLAWARTGVVLEPPADALVQALKYGGWSRAATLMAPAMARRLRPMLPPAGALLVPVPTTVSRRRRRGYNQARLLAEALADLLRIPVVEGLARGASGKSQVALPVERRRANISGAFTAGPEARSMGASFLTILVDDVLTTGATAAAAADALAALGAGRVGFVAFARTLPRPIDTVPAGPASSSIRKE